MDKKKVLVKVTITMGTWGHTDMLSGPTITGSSRGEVCSGR